MKPTAWIQTRNGASARELRSTLLPVVLVTLSMVALAPLSAAAYDPTTSVLHADAPVILTGRSDALVSQSVVSFVSSSEGAPIFLGLTADELMVAPHASSGSPCSSSPITITCPGSGASSDPAFTLTRASVTVTKALTAYKVVGANDASSAKTPAFVGGVLVASTDGTSYLGGTAARSISPTDADWDTTGKRASADAYTVPANEASFTTSSGGAISGSGGLQLMLQGLRVHVNGIKSDGSTYDHDLDTSYSSSGAQSFVVVEAKNGRLAATSAAPLSAYGTHTVDLRGAAALTHVDGNVTKDGQTTSYQKQDASLDGPVSFAVQKVETPSGSTTARLTLALSSDLRVATLTPDAQPKKDDTTQLVAAGAAGAGGAALLAGLLYFWPRIKFATALLFLPLYSRIERTAVLDHEKRDEIYELIRVSPGIHAHEIGEKTQIGWGTTVYHLKLLETHSLIVSKRSGRYKRFFVNTGEYTKKKDVYGALRNETAKAVADFIVNHPGCNQKELCAALNIQPSLASWHVEKLEGVELVKRVKDGRMVRYFAGAAWADLNVRIMPGGGADTPAET